MVKTILLSLLGFVIIWVAFILVDGILLNPYAGGEIHRITWSHPLWWEATFAVLVEYLVTVSVLVSLLILGKYPSHWSVIALEGAAIAAYECWCLRYFWTPGPDDENGWFVFGLMTLAFALIISIAWLANRLLMAFEGLYGQKP